MQTATLPNETAIVAPVKAAKKLTSKQVVQANLEMLSKMSRGEIIAFGKSNGFDSRAGFSAFKRALVSVAKIDLDAMKNAAIEAQEEKLASEVTASVTLFVDAKARCQRFAICDQNGKVVWYGRFFDGDRSFSYGDEFEQSACECAAARKAIWFASKIAESIGAKAIALNLKVDAQWLCTLSGKASILASDARRLNVQLEMEWISGTSNPADSWTTASGFKKYSDNDLPSLIG